MNSDSSKIQQIWPNFFIVGASKSGTTTLYAILDKVPSIYMSSIKEPQYFHGISFKLNTKRILAKSEYLKLFSSATNKKAIGEASTSYLQDPESVNLIHKEVPNAKIIIILRDHCQRMFSLYLMYKTKGGKDSFHQLLTAKPSFLESGLYYSRVKRYLDIFGSKQVKILIFDDFIKEPKDSIKEILAFLQINSEPPNNFEKTYNEYRAPRGIISKKILRSDSISKISDKLLPKSLKWKLKEAIILKNEKKPQFTNEHRIIMENYYREDARNLQNLIKRKLPWKWIDEDIIK